MLIHLFRRGLKPSIKDELATTPRPTDFDTFVQLVIDIDERLHERATERGRERRSIIPTPSYGSVPAAPSAPRASSREHRPDRRPFPPLTEQQKDHRHQNNLCMYCGDPSHAIFDC